MQIADKQGQGERTLHGCRLCSGFQALKFHARAWFGDPGCSSKQANAARLFLGYSNRLALVQGYFELPRSLRANGYSAHHFTLMQSSVSVAAPLPEAVLASKSCTT
jgi:hypothetical protein